MPDPIVFLADDGLSGEPLQRFRTRMMTMGAQSVLQALMQGPQELPAYRKALRGRIGDAPLFVATTRPEWAFGWLRLCPGLVDGIFLVGGISGASTSTWGLIFDLASHMTGPSERRVWVDLELESPPELSAALLVGCRRAFWAPYPNRLVGTSPKVTARFFEIPGNRWVHSHAEGLAIVTQPGSPSEPLYTEVALPEAADDRLWAARLLHGDRGVPIGPGVPPLLDQWTFRLQAQTLLSRPEEFLRWMEAPGYDRLKAGGVGLAILNGFVPPAGQEGWQERLLGRVAAAMELPPASPGSSGRLVFHTSQLLTIRHSPTLSVFNILEGVLRLNSRLEALLVVEECLIPSPEEDFPQAIRRANHSVLCRSQHQERLKASGLEGRVHLYYACTGDSRVERTRALVEAVRAWGPDAIVGVGTDASVARVWMYASYPYVAVTLGGSPRSGRADIFGRPPTMAQPWPADLQQPGAVRDYVPFFELPVAQRSWTKADLGWTEEEVVLVTVSNRPASELTEELLDILLTALQDHAHLRWVVVGDVDAEEFPQLTARPDRIRLHGYEKDLAGLYGACDLYVNPFRSGGGVSVGMAMKAGLPVLTREDSVDARSWVGDAAEALDGAGYVRELQRLVGSAEARREMGERMKRRVETVNEERSTLRLLELLEEARILYRARISASGSPDQSR